MDMLEYEKKLRGQGYHAVAGVDEAGRGPLAGPVYAAAVILPSDFYDERINDSKKLSAKKREELFDVITQAAASYCIASVSEQVIDEINILQATMRAMAEAVAGLSAKPDYVLIDGNRMPVLQVPGEAVVKGDAKSLSIASASILAKVARDRYMTEMALSFPEYNFTKHKGYGTREHVEKIKQYGPCSIHRRSFLKKIL